MTNLHANSRADLPITRIIRNRNLTTTKWETRKLVGVTTIRALGSGVSNPYPNINTKERYSRFPPGVVREYKPGKDLGGSEPVKSLGVEPPVQAVPVPRKG